MNFKYYIVCILGLSTALIGCSGPPEVSAENCAGRGMERALDFYKNNEAERQAFIDKCNALPK
ncbi:MULTISPECIES: entry exclusion lipoprotein TrbK [Nitrosomonas]|uniref:entry exclusion lipoprotein TrbK n=1 Tax=Nitrosomonas TaxID=914 RepID=UPI0002DC2821|nr:MULTISPECIES: entry exclusion lipoprotein TrbK [Nitrosomonas]MCE7916463.1 entry exclusion lipoprotein TrbK [Nitrosomonas sp. PRO5]KXK38289.1 MAG: hypothetical protein UZ02_AOB001002242 [Nitrosomonas europaea]MBV6390001.1 hypothetical protein [Nitrosomonas europaea]MEB2331919.1 entry exclusion lipoprotein TrbK [Nitrosomonas sp.]QOJ08168.1 MAG: entry exclusion lipoprotein TrbK [Nitrosomonas sp. H1_AOB3]